MAMQYKTYNYSRRKSFDINYVMKLLAWSFVAVPLASSAFNLQSLHQSAYRDIFRCLTQMHSKASVEDGDESRMLSADSIYYDIEIANQPIGRLVFHLTNPSSLPKHAENIIQLAKGSRRGIDPKAHYVGCEFDFSPVAIEDGMGRYRWGHQLRGRGRNGIGRADEAITDPESQAKCCHSTFGGQYYGDMYTQIENDPGVMLTVPVVGPGYGSTKFSIVRVEESPKEWRETLLINSGVIGRLDVSSLDVLYTMARQRLGPPTIVSAGVLDS